MFCPVGVCVQNDWQQNQTSLATTTAARLDQVEARQLVLDARRPGTADSSAGGGGAPNEAGWTAALHEARTEARVQAEELARALAALKVRMPSTLGWQCVFVCA